MKTIALLIYLSLSFLSGDKDVHAQADRQPDPAQHQELCLTSVHGYAFSGIDTTLSLRTSPSGRRTQAQTKSTFRLVKGGKIVDTKHRQSILIRSFRLSSGIYFSERYLYSICRLRL